MAYQILGFQHLAPSEYDTYDHWRNFALTHGVDVDYAFGNQCYDLIALLYFQYGRTFYLGGQGYAYEAWTVSQARNSQSPFVAVERNQIKKGDVVVFGTAFSVYGHVAMADEDYDGGNYIWLVGQNQGQGISWGTPSNRWHCPYAYNLMGGFRNTNWQTVPPPTPVEDEEKKKGFPWVLYSRKLRGQK